jgi:hypothetical protein
MTDRNDTETKLIKKNGGEWQNMKKFKRWKEIVKIDKEHRNDQDVAVEKKRD